MAEETVVERTVEIETEPSENLMAKILEKLEPKFQQSIEETMMRVLKKQAPTPEDPDSDDDSVRSATKRKQDDVLSLFAGDVDGLNPTPKKKTPSDYSSITSPSPSSNKLGSSRRQDSGVGSSQGSNPNAARGSNPDANKENKGDNPEKDNPQHLNMVEEMLRQVDEEMEVTEDYGPDIKEAIAERVVRYFTKGARNSETRSKIFKKFKLAKNVEAIDTPKMHQGLLKAKSVTKYVNRGDHSGDHGSGHHN